jgi:hypothetical protein
MKNEELPEFCTQMTPIDVEGEVTAIDFMR